LGTVHFATTCSPVVAPQFNRAVALLHSFEFGESIRAFNEVLAADSTCAMAHWGIALSRWTNPMAPGNRSVAQLQQGRQSVDAAMRLGVRASEREREYIHAVSQLYDDFEHKDQRTRVVAYERAMNELVMRQPADTEAMIFYAISQDIRQSAEGGQHSRAALGEAAESPRARALHHPHLRLSATR